jgi:hypothetical protein
MQDQSKNGWDALYAIVNFGKYIVCILLFVCSFSEFYEGDIYTAIVQLVTAIIFLPFVSKRWKRKLPFLDYYLIRRILFFLLLMLASYFNNLHLANSI